MVEKIYLEPVLHVNLDVAADHINSTLLKRVIINGSNATGYGQTVCIIDTGTEYNHTYLGGCLGDDCIVVGGYDFVNDDEDPWDDSTGAKASHGTHVSGIIASTDSTYRGIAPGARIVSIKACNSAGDCLGSDIISAFDWCVYNKTKFNISVISLSAGSGKYNSSTCPTDSMTAAITDAYDAGIFVSIASGNEYYDDGINYPACTENATSVGSITDSYLMSGFTNTDSLLDVVAPGEDITSTVKGNGFASKSGTSMATPMVSAVAALMQSYYKLQTGSLLTPEQIRSKLKSTAIINITDGDDFPLINAYFAALDSDNLAPQITFVDPSPSNNEVINRTNVFINITSSETLYIAYLEWNLSSNISMNGSSTNWYANMTGSGNITIKIFANDSASNIAVSTLTFVLNNTAPNITSYYPRSSNINITVPYNLTFNISYNDHENDSLTFTWKLNGTTVSTSDTYNFTGTSSNGGIYNVTVIVSDGFSSDSFYGILLLTGNLILHQFILYQTGLQTVLCLYVKTQQYLT